MTNEVKKITEERAKEDYKKLLASGMFFEFHPELTGYWDRDKEAWFKICKKWYD